MISTFKSIPNIFIGIFIMAGFCVNAQENFTQGRLIKKDGTTENGEIDYRNWKINPIEIKFKSNGKVTTYKPQDLSSFHVDEDNYYGAKVEKELSGNHINDIDFEKDFKIEEDHVFLREVISNEKRFFQLNELNASKSNFYILDGEEFKLLRFKKYFFEDDLGKKFIKENKEFIRVLKNIFLTVMTWTNT